MQRRHRRRKYLFIFVATALLGVFCGLAVFTVSASAMEESKCGGPVNTQAHLGEWRRGVRSASPYGITVAPNTVKCAHVNSLFVWDTADGVERVEVGWVDSTLGGCNSFQTKELPSGGPYFFEAFHDSDGSFYCDYNSSVLTDGDVLTARASDDNNDFIWHFYKNGNEQGREYVTDFRAGDPIAQGERHSAGDSDNARIRNLDYMDSTGWHDWDQASRFYDCDTAFGITITGTTDIKVSQKSDGTLNSPYLTCSRTLP